MLEDTQGVVRVGLLLLAVFVLRKYIDWRRAAASVKCVSVSYPSSPLPFPLSPS